MEENGDLNSAVQSGLETASELPDKEYRLNLEDRLKEAQYRSSKRSNRIEMYTEYQNTLLNAIECGKVPSHIEVEDDEEELWDQIRRASRMIGEEWRSLRKDLQELDTRMTELENDWKRYRENSIHEPKFLQKHEMDRPEDYHELSESYCILRGKAAQVKDKISVMEDKLPDEVTGKLPDEDELSVV